MGYQAVVIGSSTGGMDALKIILEVLPKNFSVPILVVQHTSSHSDNYLAKFLDNACKVSVKEAEEKEKAIAGHVYIAPPNYHLLVEKDGSISLSVEARVSYARPSIDVLFESAAEAYNKGLIGLVLTGANNDGSKGLKRIKECCGLTIVQDPITAQADTMPRAALRATKVDHIVSLEQIGPFLNKIIQEKSGDRRGNK
ncbi:chemotaxis protein CheB [Desulfosporosinus sp. Sb-LF]|uniref:chemotaxis protein CheB n=1 Tax=Desulfosporosinus sp. Sb-LF TaxID=2560027 RepID=UPI00107F85F4|nr:chemotaxis protein CheB [Desulfosporosinus sp. Sb-LF]TGE33597.1 chemotaxis protein CheB [Desulfosporosinus sp. Sb-LF]